MKLRKLKKVKIANALSVKKRWTIYIEVDVEKGVIRSFYPNGSIYEQGIEEETLKQLRG